MEIEKYIITYKIGNDIPINPDWIRSKLQAAVKELQAEIDKKPLNGQHVLEFKTSSKLQAWQPVPDMIGYIRKRYNMETKQLKRIADAIEEILRLVREDMKEMKKAAKWKK